MLKLIVEVEHGTSSVFSRTRLFMEPWFQGRAITEKMKRLDNVVSVYMPQASPHFVNVNVSRGLSITMSLRSKFFLLWRVIGNFLKHEFPKCFVDVLQDEKWHFQCFQLGHRLKNTTDHRSFIPRNT